jgi:hypothetical protein
MTELEYDRLLEMIGEAVGSEARDDEMSAARCVRNEPCAANDNQTAWPLLPFPAGWCASC